MIPRGLLPGCALLWALVAQAFVLDLDENGVARRWDLVTPEAHVGPQAAIQVSTNALNPTTRAIRFFVAAEAYSTTNTTAELNAVRASFGQWQAVTGTLLKFEEGGLAAAGVDVNELDHTNVVFWAKRSTLVADGTADIGNAMAMTFLASISGVMVGADIVMNGHSSRGYAWFTDPTYTPPAGRWQFVEGPLTHEVGHLLGLEHSPIGGATMLFRGPMGLNSTAGLSLDEVAGARSLYGTPTFLASKGRIQGTVTLNGAGVLGAVVVAQDGAGNVAEGAVTRADGRYELAALEPGAYALRVCPLDPPSTFYLVRGVDILDPPYGSAQTRFLPSANVTVQAQANQTTVRDFAVTGGDPPFRISLLRQPTTNASSQTGITWPAVLRVGQSNLIVGVYGAGLPTTGAVLSISGDGIHLTPVASPSGISGLGLLSASVNVSPTATPGLRSFMVQRGNDVAYANGFIDVLPLWPDDNFDGVDDLWQRRYFPLFTAPEAGPGMDPDHDGFSNSYEWQRGSSPIDAGSLPRARILRLSLNQQGSTLSWQSVPGGRYQVFRRDEFSPATRWRAVGSPVVAAGAEASLLDSAITNRMGYYRVQLLPNVP